MNLSLTLNCKGITEEQIEEFRKELKKLLCTLLEKYEVKDIEVLLNYY